MANAKKQALTAEELLAQALVPADEQPYDVPDNWVWTRYENAVSPSDAKMETFSSDVKYIGLEHIEKDGGILGHGDASELKSLKNVFSVGDILYGKLRPYLNKHDIATFDGVCSTDILVFKPAENCDARLANYFLDLSNFIEYAVSNSKGINLPRVSKEVVLAAAFPLPPLPEQHRIVARIESLFDKLDRAKALVQSALDSFETRRAAILHKAFTGELTAKWREENGIGLDSWESTTLGEMCKISSGGTPSRTIPKYYDGNIPWVKTGEIIWNTIYDTDEHITQTAIENSSAKLFPKGTVLVAMYGQGLTRGRAAILGVEATTNQAVCALMPTSKVLNYFIYYYFECNYWELRGKAVGGNQPNFSGTMISKFPINAPGILEQKEIVRILDDLLEKEQAAQELTNTIEKIDHMKKAILARAFRGELGTNDPSEESAAELLKSAATEVK